MKRDVFRAIADPTRRDILALLSKQPLNLNAVAENFAVSRPAVSKHIKLLAECGLILIKQQGRERYCEAKLEGLAEAAAWIDQYRGFWTAKLDALDTFLAAQTPKRKPPPKKKRK